MWDYSSNKVDNKIKPPLNTGAYNEDSIIFSHLINPINNPLLVTTSRLGIIRAYRNFDNEECELITAWKLTNQLSFHSSGKMMKPVSLGSSTRPFITANGDMKPWPIITAWN